MQARFVPVIASFLVCLLATSRQSLGQSYTSFGWHYILTQAGRNAAIVQQAQKYPNGAYGGQCKVWVQNVVWNASGRNVWLPTNSNTYDWKWNSSQWVQAVATDHWNLSVRPGMIIQAQVRYGRWPYTSPHTMIVLGSDIYYISVIESNYGAGFVEKVNRRTMRWADFKRDILHHTIYEVK